MNISKYIKKNQIISIVGATSTGKTAYSLSLSKKLLALGKIKRVHLLSADSKQVYRGLEHLTGADLPSGFSKVLDKKFTKKYFSNQEKSIFLHGVSIIDTSQEWSAAHFRKLFIELKTQLAEDDFLIVVGGTGFYQRQVFDPAENILFPQDKKLRQRLEKLNLEELRNELTKADKNRLQNMNNSDVNNPRRLIRAIEVAALRKKTTTVDNIIVENKKAVKKPIFYLELPREVREQKIKQRVVDRFEQAKKEVAKQLETRHFSSLAAATLGFKELKEFIEAKIDKETCLGLWQIAEIQYAKRQDTWWKKITELCYI